MKKYLLFFIVLYGCSYIGYLKDPFVEIPQFHKVNENLYRGGQPTEEGFKKIKSLGIKTVISLRGENEELHQEKVLINALGMNFFHIPLSVYRRPTDTEVLQFLEIILTKENQPVFIHCESGRDRTGALIALYRVVVDGWSIKTAYTEAKKYGFWPYRGKTPELKNFIHQLKDKPLYFKKAKELKKENAQ
jgi:uncharacterized protein (TIGR01244 family)